MLKTRFYPSGKRKFLILSPSTTGTLPWRKFCREAINTRCFISGNGENPCFYFLQGNVLGIPMAKVFRSIAESPLPESMSTAIISLIYNKGDPTDIANYRPVSVLCHDVKILAKILLLRLHPVIPLIIGTDQTGVKGRYIGEAIRQFLDVCEYLNIERKSAMILLMDQRKVLSRGSFFIKFSNTLEFHPS